MGPFFCARLFSFFENICDIWGLPVLVLSMHNTALWAQRAFKAGASGYASKQEMGETLLIAIRCVLGGARYLSPKIKVGPDIK